MSIVDLKIVQSVALFIQTPLLSRNPNGGVKHVAELSLGTRHQLQHNGYLISHKDHLNFHYSNEKAHSIT